ncbi:MAG: hypothetical protein F4Z73_01910 [Synechococcus sp. SB0668_bin_13]|nr:hypothetical protein [Synechococcus sp. SB0668_bin_13]
MQHQNEVLMLDATYVKAQRTASSLNKWGAALRLSATPCGGLTSKRPLVCDGKGRPVRASPPTQ